MSGFRIFGIVVAVVGIVATLFPEWFGPLTRAAEPTTDLHELVERRVRGGMVFGVGIVFVAVTSLRPWSVSIPWAIFFWVAGVLAVRLVALVAIGATPKQWLLVGVEAVIMAACAFWLWRSSGSAS